MATQRQKEINATKRACAREARFCADSIIEQRERQSRGLDKGTHRDDEPFPTAYNAINVQIRFNVKRAFGLSAQCAALVP